MLTGLKTILGDYFIVRFWGILDFHAIGKFLESAEAFKIEAWIQILRNLLYVLFIVVSMNEEASKDSF